MRKYILLGFGLMIAIVLCGSIAAVVSLNRTTERTDRLIMLHQVEILRENLIIRIQQVQSYLSRSDLRHEGEKDALIAQVQEMDRVIESCVGCHHAPELAQGISAMCDLANDYKAEIGRLFNTPIDSQKAVRHVRRAQDIGHDLLGMAEGMAFSANVLLKQKTMDSLGMMRAVKRILYGTLALGFAMAVATSLLLVRRLDQRMRMILDATSRIAQGDLQHRIALPDSEGEFFELGRAFNTMTQNLQASERRVIQGARFTAIGELVTRLAYEVNNPLSGIIGHTGLLLKDDDLSPHYREQLRIIERETQRAQQVLKHLLDFARRRPPQLALIDLSAVLRRAIHSQFERTLNAPVELIEEYCSQDTAMVRADAEEMHQVFATLASHAIAAMPAGGRLSVRCMPSQAQPGRAMLAVEIADTGPGIPFDQLDKIFDPFFPARAVSGGTELDLSICYMITRNHGGWIEVESSGGEGALFRVIVPTASADPPVS